MESSLEEKMNLDPESISETKINQEFFNLNFGNSSDEAINNHGDDYEGEGDEEEFSFMFGEAILSPIAAEDVFMDGQIKPIFPLFNRDLVLSDLPINLPVNKVFVETSNGNYEQVTSSTLENDELSGPHCEWSNSKAVEAETAPEVCKKSNSTGFSKIWRFKDFLGRSNSDGRDAFVFLNNDQSPPSSAAEQTPVEVVVKRDEPIVNVIKKVKNVSKGKTVSLSAHEVYMRSKAKEAERRRSYLPYRPQITGFFTNVNGGLTKNVHPF